MGTEDSIEEGRWVTQPQYGCLKRPQEIMLLTLHPQKATMHIVHSYKYTDIALIYSSNLD